jgi:hypothetical protein
MNPELNREYPDPGEAKLIEEMVKVAVERMKLRMAVGFIGGGLMAFGARMAGSYVFAEASGWLARTLNRWGDRGVLTLDRVLNLKPRVLVPVVATVLVLALGAIHLFVDPTP